MSGDVPAGWEGILDPGERILWQGRPGTRIRLTAGNVMTSIFGLFFAGFALFWMIMASQAGGAFWMFGLIHFSVGLGLAIAPQFWASWRRRHTWYTLTDRRAFIATDIPLQGRKLKSYPIDGSTKLDLEMGDPGSVWFAEEFRRGRNGSYRTPIGFERIEDGARVYGLCREVQKGSRAA